VEVAALSEAFRRHECSRAIEVGCGTGDYSAALAANFPGVAFFGFDLSLGMLRLAITDGASARVVAACAEETWPFSNQTSDFVFSVDVMQHLRDFSAFFREAGRVLCGGGTLALVTDSEEDIRNRSLGKFFPETLPINFARYPKLAFLQQIAAETSMELVSQQNCGGHIKLDSQFIAALQEKALSELRLISPEAHRAGMARAVTAQSRGEKWLSRSTMLLFRQTGRLTVAAAKAPHAIVVTLPLRHPREDEQNTDAHRQIRSGRLGIELDQECARFRLDEAVPSAVVGRWTSFMKNCGEVAADVVEANEEAMPLLILSLRRE
jgi:ubiquinone/menaquinone biosynthesis C-methylase UbiE